LNSKIEQKKEHNMDRIRAILDQFGKLKVPASTLAPETDLYDAGLTSFASVQLMLALEEAFDVEFPETMLNRKTFSSMSAINNAIGEITRAAA
jgi:acyl carrier protein